MLFSPISLYLLSLWHFYYDFNSKQHQNVDEFSIFPKWEEDPHTTQVKGLSQQFYVEKKR